jgi:hypothetical protein
MKTSIFLAACLGMFGPATGCEGRVEEGKSALVGKQSVGTAGEAANETSYCRWAGQCKLAGTLCCWDHRPDSGCPGPYHAMCCWKAGHSCTGVTSQECCSRSCSGSNGKCT